MPDQVPDQTFGPAEIKGARLAEDVAKQVWDAQTNIQRHQAAHRRAQDAERAGMGLDVEQVQFLLGQRQDLAGEKAEVGLTAAVLDAAGLAAVMRHGQREWTDALLGDQVADDGDDPAGAAIILPVQDDQQGTGLGRGRLVEAHAPFAAYQEEGVLDEAARESAVGHAVPAPGM